MDSSPKTFPGQYLVLNERHQIEREEGAMQSFMWLMAVTCHETQVWMSCD